MRDNLDLARSYRRLSDVCDEWLTPIVSIAVAVGILRSVPSILLFVSMLFGSLASFLAGVCTGVAGFCLFLVALWFLITKEYKKKDSDSSTKPGTIPNPHPARYELNASEDGQSRRMTPPAQMAIKGRFFGIIWTAHISEWDRHEALKDIDIQNKRVKKWMAILDGGRLTLVPDQRRRTSQPIVMAMEGCRIKVVTECIGVKSPWWKKGPLEISHHDRELLDGEQAFFMFCEHGGAKEQWYIALSRLDHEGDSVQLLQDMYSRYSALCHQKQYAAFPFLGLSQTPNTGNSPKEREVRHPRRGWIRRWWVHGKNGSSGKAMGDAQELKTRGSLDMEEEGNPIAEMDRMWMTGGWPSKRDENGMDKKPGMQQIIKESPLQASPELRTETDFDGEEGLIIPEVAGSSPKSIESVSSPPSVQGSPWSAHMSTLDAGSPQNLVETDVNGGIERQLESKVCKDVYLDANGDESMKSQTFASMGSEGNEPLSDRLVSPKSDDNPSATPMRKEKPGISPSESLDGIHGLNMFLARWAFDLARNPLFEEKFKDRLQKKINGLRRPSFVNPLTLVGMEVGTNFPVIHNVRSLPSPSKVIWPQLLLDISYSGGLELVLETTVDLNETQAWSALDKAINIIGGQDQDQSIKHEGSGLSGNPVDDSDSQIDQGMNPGENRMGRKLIGMLPLRKAFAGRAKKLADKMADSISKIPLRLFLHTSRLEGQLLVWMSPPPSDRLWLSFVGMPQLELHAKPILANRVMKYSAQLGRVSAWLEKKLQSSLFKSLVFPNCTDVRFPGLLGLLGDWGLRHPGKNLLSELASVAASDGEGEAASDTRDKEEMDLGTDADVELANLSTVNGLAINKAEGSSLKGLPSNFIAPISLNKSQGSYPGGKRTGPQPLKKERSRSFARETLVPIEEETHLRAVRSRSVEAGLCDFQLRFDAASKEQESGSHSDGGADHSGEGSPFRSAYPQHMGDIGGLENLRDEALAAKHMNRAWSAEGHISLDGRLEGFAQTDMGQSSSSSETAHRMPITRDNSRRKAMMQAAKLRANKQTSRMKEVIGTKAAQFKRAAVEGKLLIATRKNSE